MKHTFNRLARGVKLQVGHVYTAASSALANLTEKAGGVDGVVADQLAAPDGPFTIHLSIPNFGAARKAASIPFVLPAYQDDSIWANLYPAEGTPVFKIEDVGFSFDSHDELAAVGGYGAADQDKAIFGGLSDYKVEVSILETEQKINASGYFNVSQSRYSTVWSNTIPAAAWEAGLNPHTYSEISAELSPMRTYILRVVAPDLDAPAPIVYAMPNLNIWLKLSTKMAPRDVHDPSGGKYVQNIPSVHDGAVQTTSITVTAPTPGDTITADTTVPHDGIQTALGKVDKIFRDKLRGGYNIHSELPADENLTDGTAYKVIAVPMWGNLREDITTANVGVAMPYIGSSPHVAMMTDRRVIPISNNFTVHHVIACANYGDDNLYPKRAAAPAVSFTHNVGVGIGSGLRSDLHTYQQVAYLRWNPYGAVSHEIDTCHVTLDDTLNDFWEIVSAPVVHIAGEVSANYGPQGKPFFIGQARGLTIPRVDVGTTVGGSGGSPNTDGQESFIEVRWGIQDTTDVTTLDAGSLIVPRYGYWVYIIGKTTTVTSNQE